VDKRREDIAFEAEKGCRGCEVGVADGQFSERLIKTGVFSEFYSVDKWDDAGHPIRQYEGVVERLSKFPESKIVRSTAQDFARLVPDNYFGFIYIDCYAHTGQDDGEVLECMWPKLKPGGIFAGDDYDFKIWPKTVATVSRFVTERGLSLHVWAGFVEQHGMDKHPSWWVRKPTYEGHVDGERDKSG
jgi:hypothetical protein